MSEKQSGYSINDADYIMRECVNAIKGSIDQIYYGLLEYLSEDERKRFLSYLKNQSDSLQDVLYKAIIEKANKMNDLNIQLTKSNKELNILKQSLESKIAKRSKEIKKVQHVTIFALARLAESRDQETGGHLNRIRSYSYLLAKKLSRTKSYRGYIDAKYASNIYHSSPLHDIGKVGIADAILLKPGKLTVDEFENMKNHTIIGGKTLEDAEKQLKYKTKSFLGMGKNIAYCHHEKWNGTGYPFGLKGTEIPLSARIVTLADVYDALTSKRVYKDAFPHEVAKEMIVQERNKHFDPEIVDAFLSLEEAFKDKKYHEDQ